MKRGLLITLVVLSVLVGAGGLLFAFGTPQTPDAVTPVAASGEGVAAQRDVAPPRDDTGVPTMGGGDPSAIGKEAPPADPASPLAIEIPGCVCHSDDQKLVEEHASYRMNQCYGCHAGAPGGGS
jgi:hypothetical protein